MSVTNHSAFPAARFNVVVAVDWADNGRDILQFILTYLPDSESEEGPSTSYKSAAALVSSVTKDALRTTAVSTPPNNGNVQGWMTEVEGMASIAPPRPAAPANPSLPPSSIPIPPSTSKSSIISLVPHVLPSQPLPADFEDALSLDLSSSSAINNTLRPLPPQRWRRRRIALVGHSVGAAGMVFAASVFPHLFESVVCVDPTIFPAWIERWPRTVLLTDAAIVRRDGWASREAARATFEKNKRFYGRWDVEVLQRHVEFGLVKKVEKDGQGESEEQKHGQKQESKQKQKEAQVVLKTDKMQEAYVYADVDNHGSKRAFHRLAYLPSSIHAFIVRADVGLSTVPEETFDDFRKIVKNAKHARVANAAHLVVQEKPKELALLIGAFFREVENGDRMARL